MEYGGTDVNKGLFGRTNRMSAKATAKEGDVLREDYVSGTGKSFLKNVPLQTLQGAKAGSEFGTAGAIVGGAIGFVSGLMGMGAEIQGQELDFKKALESSKLKKEQEKMAKAAQKEALRLSKQKEGKRDRPPDLIPEADSDIMAMMQRGGTSQYDQGMGGLYGYG